MLDVKTVTAFAAGAALGCAVAVAVSHRAITPNAGLAPAAVEPQPPAEAPGCAAPGVCLDDVIVGEQLTRNVQFFGRDNQQRVCDAFVVVVGLGVRSRSPLAAGDVSFPVQILTMWPLC
jgi:hypothetical protein